VVMFVAVPFVRRATGRRVDARDIPVSVAEGTPRHSASFVVAPSIVMRPGGTATATIALLRLDCQLKSRWASRIPWGAPSPLLWRPIDISLLMRSVRMAPPPGLGSHAPVAGLQPCGCAQAVAHLAGSHTHVFGFGWDPTAHCVPVHDGF